MARGIPQPLTDSNLSNDAFPYLTTQSLMVGFTPCRALRVSYVGELGWELSCPVEFGAQLWDTLWDAGRAHGLGAEGYRRRGSMRQQKGCRVWHSDMTAGG